MFGDLHFHSTDSDGLHSNDHIITQIQSIDPRNQGIWAMTNHDCYSPTFVEPARSLGINAIWATEISAHSKEIDTSLHITCYTPLLSESIRGLIDGVLLGKAKKVSNQITLLRSNGFPISYDEFARWVLSKGYRLTHVSNAQISEFLFSNERKVETLRVLADHTSGSISTSSDFLHECLKEHGIYAHLGSVNNIDPYEPELSDLMDLARKQDILFSVAHPNFSFASVYKRVGIKLNTEMSGEYFYSHILPELDDLGVRNYEVNAMTTPEQAHAIQRIVQKRNGLITYGSDNHGKSKTDAKHGLLGVQNPYLTESMLRRTRAKLQSYLPH